MLQDDLKMMENELKIKYKENDNSEKYPYA